MSRSALKALMGRRIRAFSTRDVTTIGDREEGPEAAGLARGAHERIWKAVVKYYKRRLHPAIALCLRYRGRVIFDRTIGHSHGNGPDSQEMNPVLATPDTLFHLFSASKGLLAVLINRLVEKEMLALDEPVVTWIPEFGRHGKESITLRHLLCHQAGIAKTPQTVLDLKVLHDRQAIVDMVCDLKPTARPGEQLAYHPLTAGSVLGEVVHRVTGKDLREHMAEVICRPMGLKTLSYGTSETLLPTVAEDHVTGPAIPQFVDGFVSQMLGADLKSVIEIANDPLYRTAIVPSGNAIGTADEICQFYEMLLRGGTLNGVRIIDAGTVARAIAWQKHSLRDRTLPIPMRYGLGFMLGSPGFSLYGSGTLRVFGHMGFTNLLTWADPQRDLSGALICTGKPLVTPEWLAWHGLLSTIAREIPSIY